MHPLVSLGIDDPETVALAPNIASSRLIRLSDIGAFWLFIGILAWAPFPLGSNRPWSWSVLMLLVALAWTLWALSVWALSLCSNAEALRQLSWRLSPAIGLALLALLWGLVQIVPLVPASWAHPIWALSADALGHPLTGTISLNPWESGTALMKLGACAMMFWLSAVLTQRAERALMLLNALIAIGAFYAAYALVLGSLGTGQFQLFYGGPSPGGLSGPFVSRNNFATLMGLAALCSAVRLVSLSSNIVIDRGLRPLLLTGLQYLFGNGVLPAVALTLSFSMVVASGSRAGFLATLVGMIVLLLLASAIARRRLTSYWGFAGIFLIIELGFALFLLNGATLQERFVNLLDDNAVDQGRLIFWAAAWRMIGASPWLGLGLGTFENAYPLYADSVIPLIVDKTHNDYLELAAGWGLPATGLWLAALLWLTALCVFGVFHRRRNQGYPLLAVGATALVGCHSLFDFSLQIPAIALFYAAILGLGVAQSFSTRSS